MDRTDILELLAQYLAQMPAVQKKVLAMYYHEDMSLSDIATCFGLTESRIRQIHRQGVVSLREIFVTHLRVRLSSFEDVLDLPSEA